MWALLPLGGEGAEPLIGVLARCTKVSCQSEKLCKITHLDHEELDIEPDATLADEMQRPA